MEETQKLKNVERWHLHPDDIAARYAIVFSQLNNHAIGSETFFDVWHEMERLIQSGITSGKLKLRTWPGRFVLPASTPITDSTLIDLQDLCDSANDLGFDCPINAIDLAKIFRLLPPEHIEAPKKNLGTPPKLTEANKTEILTLYNRSKGMSVNALAKKFEVSRPTIDKVLRNADIKK